MANSASSSSAAPALSSSLGHPVTERLTKNNHMLWKAQVLPALRGTQLTGFLDGTAVPPPQTVIIKSGDKDIQEANPEFIKWVALDQQVLGYLFSSLSREVLAHVASMTKASQVWKAIEDMLPHRSEHEESIFAWLLLLPRRAQ